MSESNQKLEADRQLILDAQKQGTGAKVSAYVKLSGPGWLQSAITLGGGSLAGSLFLGVLGGYSLLWLQLVAMIFGVIMLSAISYVTLSTGEKPFRAINRHINPVLGWGWALATMAANIVWCLPQFSLGTAAIQQNLLGIEGTGVKIASAAFLFIVGVSVIWSYESGNRGVKIFETILKILVGVVVVSFFGVVATMSIFGEKGLPWGEILSGFIPDLSLLTSPASTFEPYIAAAGDFSSYWHDKIVNDQQDVLIAAAATAVGINMTFLLPYSMLKKGWNSDFRGLAIFDLSTGLFVPFVLATSCVVIASASQFHTKYEPALMGEPGVDGQVIEAPESLVGRHDKILDARIEHEVGKEAFVALTPEALDAARKALPEAERRIAAMLIDRKAGDLSQSLAPLTGEVVANKIFGIGVMGMAISTIIILMLINGFVICEIFGLPSGGTAHRIGCLIPALVGVFGPFVWGRAAFYLAVPTSVFGFILLPIAYSTFFLMMNQKKLLGDAIPRGGKRVAWNTLMGLAVVLAGVGSVYMVHKKAGSSGIHGIMYFIVLAVGVYLGKRIAYKEMKSNQEEP